MRNENSTRPWQHVLEPLSGYLLLGQKLWNEISAENIEQTHFKELSSAFNFGPLPGSDRAVRDLVTQTQIYAFAVHRTARRLFNFVA